MKNFADLKLKIFNRDDMEIGGALRQALVQARDEGRVTCGVYESGKMLEMDPDGVMLCVLPRNAHEDVTLHIHFTLIEAFCWENDIRLLKVDSGEKLGELLMQDDSCRPPLNDNQASSPDSTPPSPTPASSAVNCILVQYPAGQCSDAEEDVMEFCKMTSDLSPMPVVNLAV